MYSIVAMILEGIILAFLLYIASRKKKAKEEAYFSKVKTVKPKTEKLKEKLKKPKKPKSHFFKKLISRIDYVVGYPFMILGRGIDKAKASFKEYRINSARKKTLKKARKAVEKERKAREKERRKELKRIEEEKRKEERRIEEIHQAELRLLEEKRLTLIRERELEEEGKEKERQRTEEERKAEGIYQAKLRLLEEKRLKIVRGKGIGEERKFFFTMVFLGLLALFIFSLFKPTFDFPGLSVRVFWSLIILTSIIVLYYLDFFKFLKELNKIKEAYGNRVRINNEETKENVAKGEKTVEIEKTVIKQKKGSEKGFFSKIIDSLADR